MRRAESQEEERAGLEGNMEVVVVGMRGWGGLKEEEPSLSGGTRKCSPSQRGRVSPSAGSR